MGQSVKENLTNIWGFIKIKKTASNPDLNKENQKKNLVNPAIRIRSFTSYLSQNSDRTSSELTEDS